MEPKVFVVIPAYNEDSILRATVSEILKRGYSTVVVDDGSARPASEVLAGLNVWCLRHNVNLGQGAALQTGQLFALSRNADIIVHFDADGQHPAELIDRVIEPILNRTADVVLGSRFLNPVDARQVPFKKRLVLRAGILVSWMFTGVWLSDTHNGFRALSRAAAGRIVIRENGFAHATEILDLLRRSKLRYCEVPVAVHYSEYSASKGQSVLNSFNILFDLILRRIFH